MNTKKNPKKKHNANFDTIIAKLTDSEKWALSKSLMPSLRSPNDVNIGATIRFANDLLRAIDNQKYGLKSNAIFKPMSNKEKPATVFVEKSLTLTEFQQLQTDFPNMIEEDKKDKALEHNYKYVGTFGSAKLFVLGDITKKIKDKVYGKET